MREAIMLTCNGETKSFKEWSDITGIPAQTIYNRYRKGFTAEKILKSVTTLIEYNGEKKSMKEWSEELNIPYSTLYYKHKRGESLSLIINSSPLTLEYNGEELTITEWSERIKVPYGTIWKRYMQGLPIEQVLSKKIIPPTHYKLYATYNNETKSLKQWSVDLGISYQTLLYRYNRKNLRDAELFENLI